MKTTLALAAAAAAMLSTQALAGTACLRQSQIYGWHPLDNRTLIVEDDFHKKFKLTLMAPCQRLDYNLKLGFRSFGTTALSCVSPGDEVLSGTAIGPQHCPIKSIELYTPAMEKADKEAAAKKTPQ